MTSPVLPLSAVPVLPPTRYPATWPFLPPPFSTTYSNISRTVAEVSSLMTCRMGVASNCSTTLPSLSSFFSTTWGWYR